MEAAAAAAETTTIDEEQAEKLRLAKQMFDTGLGLAHATIVAFDEQDHTYVMKLSAARHDTEIVTHRVAAITSDRCVKVYDWSLSESSALQFTHRLEGHSGMVHDCSFHPQQPDILVTAADDQTVAIWDLRSGTEPVHVYRSMNPSPMYSCDINGTTIAAGGTSCLSLWDMRTNKQSRLFEDFQLEDLLVTKFKPSQPTHIFTGSEDFTICCFNTMVEDDDDALLTVMNTQQPVTRMGFFGPEEEYLWATSTVHTLSLWKIKEADRISNFTDIRNQLTQDVGVDVNYLLGCYYNAESERLFAVAGSAGGVLVLSHVQTDAVQPFAILQHDAGHNDVVRDCLVFDQDNKSVITGGQDSKICVWNTEQREFRPQPSALPVKSTHAQRAQRETESKKNRRRKPY